MAKLGFWCAIAFMVTPTGLTAQARKPAPAPVQKVTPPETVYWMSVGTSSGFGLSGKAPSAGAMMKMAMGGGMGTPIKTLELDLGSKLPASSAPPAARHTVSQPMLMGPDLPLTSPKRTAAMPGTPGEDFERPKGKLLLFWGCGETARAGQPVVIDFAKMAAGEIPPNLFSGERVRIAHPPSAGNWPSYGNWPNDDKTSQKGVPADASLVGPHKVSGNYTPDINFALRQDFMGGLDLRQTTLPSGAIGLGWNQLPAATAHFAQLFGAQGTDKDNATIVFWSSSELQTFISALGDYIAPAEAARLVGRKQLMPPTQTSCTIPKEVMAAAPTGLVTLVAHGPEENFVYPPRPPDPKITWDQEWAVKARYVSRTGAVAGMDMSGITAGTGSSDSRKGRKPPCPADTATSVGQAMGGAIGGAIGGMFGKKKKPQDCEPVGN